MTHLAIPNLGNYSIALATAVESLGIEAWATTCTTPRAMKLGIEASPDSTCLPFKAHIGHFLEAAEAGVEYALMVNSIGTCRLRYYRKLEEQILAERGVEMRIFGLGYDGFKPPVVRYFDPKPWPFLKTVVHALLKLKTLDVLELAAWRTRAREVRAGDTTTVMNQALDDLKACRSAAQTKALRRTVDERFAAVPIEPERPVVRVGLVGEVSVLRDRTLNQDIAETLGRLGAEVYNFFLLGSEIGNIFGLALKSRNSRKRLAEIAEPWLGCHIGGHALDSVAQSARCADEGFDGMVHVCPTGCMPEVSVRPVLRRVGRDKEIPVLTLSFDEHTSPVGVATRVEAFVDILQERAQSERRRAAS